MTLVDKMQEIEMSKTTDNDFDKMQEIEMSKTTDK